jgi:hypothetical protein
MKTGDYDYGTGEQDSKHSALIKCGYFLSPLVYFSVKSSVSPTESCSNCSLQNL